MSGHQTSMPPAFRWSVAAFAAYALIGAGVTLAGWFAGLPRLTDWLGSGISMFPNAALAAACSGAALIVTLLNQRWSLRVGGLLGLIVFLLGSATLFEHLSGFDLGIDQILIKPGWGKGAVAPGRMGPPASISYAILGLALVFLATGRGQLRRMVPALGIMAASISILSLMGYATGADPLFAVAQFTAIAMQTATILLAIALGVVASVPDSNPVRTLRADTAAGLLARRSLPFIIGLPIVLGWLRIRGQNAGYYDTAMGTALLMLTLVAAFCGLLAWWVGAVSKHEVERKQAEERFRTVVESAPNAMVMINEHGKIVLVNAQTEKLFGHARQDLLGQPIEFLIPNRFREKHPGFRSGYTRDPHPRPMGGGRDLFGIRKDGAEIAVEIGLGPIKTPEGSLVLATVVDISERNRLNAARLQLAAVVESSDDAIVTKSLEGIVTSWNMGAKRIFKYSGPEIIGKPLLLLIPQDRINEELEIIDRIKRGESISNYDTIRRCKDGSLINVSLTVSPIKDDTGRIVGVSKIARDITDQVGAEAERRFLAEASAMLSASLEYEATLGNLAGLVVPCISDWCAIRLLDEDGSLRHLALAHSDPFKVKALQEIVERFPADPALVQGHPNVFRTGTSELIPELPDSYLQRSARASEELAFYRSLGLKSLMCVPIKIRNRTLGTISFTQAESGRRFRAEDLALAEELGRRTAVAMESAMLYRKAKAAIEARESFMSIASHELRTPLTTLQLQLQGAIRALRKGELPATSREPLEAMILKAERHGKRLGRLIEDLLDISRIAAGKLALVPKEVDLAAIAREGIDPLQPILDEKGVTIDIDAKEPVLGRWDSFRLEQVITNLYSNALKYGNGKPIRVTVEAQADRAKLVVEDQGIGIVPEVMKRLFQPYEQGGPPGHYGGLGLGLYISRQIVEAHGGSIEVASEPGKGATFSVDLPRDFKGGGVALDFPRPTGRSHPALELPREGQSRSDPERSSP